MHEKYTLLTWFAYIKFVSAIVIYENDRKLIHMLRLLIELKLVLSSFKFKIRATVLFDVIYIYYQNINHTHVMSFIVNLFIIGDRSFISESTYYIGN